MSEPFSGPVLAFSRERTFLGEDFDDIEPTITPDLIKGVIPARGIGYLLGSSKAGKTFVGIDWSCKLARGATVMGRKAQHVGVVYIGAEDANGCRARIKAWRRAKLTGLLGEGPTSYTPFKFIPRGVNLLDDEDVDALIAQLEDYAALYEANDYRLGLVVLDTFAQCMPGGDENGSADGGRAVASMQRIEKAVGCFVLAVAHHGKAGGANGVRGWSGYDAASDATITVERDADRPDERTITLSKVKNGLDGGQIAFRLERQDLGMVDADGDALWSCVVAYSEVLPDTAPRRRPVALKPEAETVLTALGRCVDNGPHQPVPDSVEGVRPGTRGVRRSDLTLESINLGLMFDGEKRNTYNARFGRALLQLIAAKRVRVEGEGAGALVWLL